MSKPGIVSAPSIANSKRIWVCSISDGSTINHLGNFANKNIFKLFSFWVQTFLYLNICDSNDTSLFIIYFMICYILNNCCVPSIHQCKEEKQAEYVDGLARWQMCFMRLKRHRRSTAAGALVIKGRLVNLFKHKNERHIFKSSSN